MRFLHAGRVAVIGALLGAGTLAACNPTKKPSAPPPPPTPAPIMVDDDGAAGAGDCDGSGPAFTTVQAGVNAASTGAHIDVCPGTYPEQVALTGAAKTNVQLRSVTPHQAVIKAPATMADPGDIVRVNGASGVSIRDFVVAGPLPNALFCSTLARTGIRVDGGGSATISDNQITQIWSADPNLRSCNNGMAIVVGRNPENTTGSATISGNAVSHFQAKGVNVDGAGSSATITSNQVAGEGTNAGIAQVGIQVSRGAVGTVSGNLVANHAFSSPLLQSSTGIWVNQAVSGVVVSNNVSHDNDDNIGVYATSGATVRHNAATDSTIYNGIFAKADASGNEFIGNFASGNAQLDCYDQSTGGGTLGTANTWASNVGTTSFPVLLCTPPSVSSQQEGPRAQAPHGHEASPAP
jgi:parallel beta helix pectate lyase-like protein